MGSAMRTEDDGAVRSLVLCRPEEYNTITAELRDELAAAVDAAEADDYVRVVLLRAEGRATARDREDGRAADPPMLGNPSRNPALDPTRSPGM